MGSPGIVTAPTPVRRWRWLARTSFLVAALALLALLAALAAGEGADGDPPAQLSLASKDGHTMADAIIASGDSLTFSLRASWDSAHLATPPVLRIEPMPQGWSYSVNRGAPEGDGVLVPSDEPVEVTVRFSNRTSPGMYYLEPRLDLQGEHRTLVSTPLHILVTPYQLELEAILEGEKTVVPGQQLRGELRLTASEPVDREVEVIYDGGPRGWGVHLFKARVQLRQGTATSVTFTVSVPEDRPPGDYSLHFMASSQDPRAGSARTGLDLRLSSVAHLALDGAPGPMLAYTGSTEASRLVVENRGNVPSSLLLVVPDPPDSLPKGWSVKALGLPATLPPGGSLDVRIEVSVPPDPTLATEGSFHLALKVLTDRPATDLMTHVPVTVLTDRTLHIELEGTGGPIGPSGDDRHLFEAVVVVKDLGNLAEARHVALEVISEPPVEETTLSRTSLTLTSGMERQVALVVRLREGADAGEYVVRVRAVNGEGSEAWIDVRLRVPDVEVSLDGDMDVTFLDSAESILAAPQTYQYKALCTVVNDGEDNITYARVDIYDTSGGEFEHLGYVPVEDLPPGASRTVAFSFEVDGPGEHSVEARLTVPGRTPDGSENYQVDQSFEAVPAKPSDDGFPMFIVVGICLGSLAGLMAILGTEAGRTALMALLLVPLYTRLRPHQVTDHFVRGQILGYIKANPGETYSSIRKALKLSNGQFVYHARMLETQGHIRSVKDGANRRFYPADFRIPREVKDVELNQVQRMIYTIVLEYPGISQSRIARMMELAPSTVNYHLNIMTKVGVLERRRSGRLSLCFVVKEIEQG